jgi:hypothetical protein
MALTKGGMESLFILWLPWLLAELLSPDLLLPLIPVSPPY